MASLESDVSGATSSRVNRGKVCLTKVAQRRVQGIKLTVDFNKYGQPVGKVACQMQSYIGLLTRDNVKVNIDTWRHVPDDVKNLIWESVNLSYNVPQTWKKGCLKSASQKWRTLKYNLHKDYILPNENDPKKLYEPPPGSGISEKEWIQFVKPRVTMDFKNNSKIQKEKREKNYYNHRLSRKGYAGAALDMKDELHGDDEIDRAILWKKARSNKDGDIDDENLKKVVDKIGKRVSLMIKSNNMIVAHGTVFTGGGVIHGVAMPRDALRVSIDEVLAENALLPFPISDEMSTVRSALASHVAWPRELVVIRNDEKIAKKNEKKPVKENMVKCHSSLPITMKVLCFILEPMFRLGQVQQVHLDAEVFGYDVAVWIVEEDFITFCELEPITGNCILIYIWHLYTILKNEDKTKKFLFVSPFGISYVPKLSREDRARKLADRLLDAMENQLVLVPCNVCEHWILTIIEPYKDCVYLMDPLTHRNRDATWKSVVETALTIFNANKGRKKFKKAPKWEVVKGPTQPDSKQSGFYVMRYMKDIVNGVDNDSFKDTMTTLCYQSEYSQCEIDEVREDWATIVINEIDM